MRLASFQPTGTGNLIDGPVVLPRAPMGSFSLPRIPQDFADFSLDITYSVQQNDKIVQLARLEKTVALIVESNKATVRFIENDRNLRFNRNRPDPDRNRFEDVFTRGAAAAEFTFDSTFTVVAFWADGKFTVQLPNGTEVGVTMDKMGSGWRGFWQSRTGGSSIAMTPRG